MRVPVTPQTNAPAGELGYERAVDVTQGTRMLAAVVGKYAEEAEKEQKKRELFDVEKMVIDETNSLQTDFEDRTKKAPLGAYGFTQQTNTDYNARHQEIVRAVKERGYSDDAVHELETRLGVIRSQYVARAIDFQEKSNFAKTVVDADHMSLSLSQYAEKNPNGLESALKSLRTGLSFSGLSEPEQEQIFEAKKGSIIKGAQNGFAIQHPEIVTGLYGFPDETKTVTNQTTGELVNLGQAQQTVSSTLASAGMNNNVIAGFLGNFHIEAGYDGAKGDGGKASGIAQWRDDRRAAFTKMFGKDPSEASIEDQAKFVVYEMQNPKQAGMTVAQRDKILAAKTPQEAAELIDKYYERSDGKARQDRIDAATRFVGAHAEATASSLTKEDIASLHEVYDKATPETAPAMFENGKKISFDDFASKARAPGTPNKVEGIEFDAAGRTGIPVIDLATGPERMQMLTVARTIMNQREADAKAAEREAHSTQLNDFYNGLEDGKLGQSDIDQAYKSGLLGDYDERNKAQSIYDAKHKEDNALVTFNTMYRSGQKFNPYDDNAQKAVDAGFAHTVKYVSEHPDTESATPFTIAMQIWNKTGIIPSQGAVMLRGALVSTNAQELGQAAAVANNMIRVNPNAFAGVEGQGDIERAAVAYGHYIYDLGMSPNDAAMKVAADNDPQVKAKYKYNDPAKQEALKNLRTNGLNAGQVFKGAKFGSQDQLNEANQTYFEFIGQGLDNGMSQAEAMAQAAAQMQKIYGPNFEGVVVKYPPERAYPAINGTWNYVYLDAKDTVKAETGREPKHLRLTPIPGVTDEDFRRGRPARYRIIYSYESNGHEVIDSVPGEFAADVGVAQRNASIRNQQEFAKARSESLTGQREGQEAIRQVRERALRMPRH